MSVDGKRFGTPGRERWVRVAWLVLLSWAVFGGRMDAASFPTFRPETARVYLQQQLEVVAVEIGESAEALYLQARIRSQLGEKEGAEKLALQSLARDPSRPEVRLFLADLLILQDRMSEAADHLRQALVLRSDLQGAQRRLGMALERMGDPAGARKALETAVRQAPEDATARLVLGRLMLGEGQALEAAQQLERAVQLNPHLSGAFYALSQARTRLGEAEAAREAMECFRQLKQKEMAELDARNTGYDDEGYMRVLAAGFHTETAGLLLRQRQPEHAETHLRQAILVAPAETRAREVLAGLLRVGGRWAEARELCTELVRLQPSLAGHRINLGTLLLQLDEKAAAEEQLKQALELDPQQPVALNNLARLYLGTGRQQPAALELARRLVKVQPIAASYDLLGWALYANGLTHDARVATGRAVELDPTNATYRTRLQRLGSAP
ncbi:MAG: tetratricopeptide repeat protein [Verrucomicrobiales bacterium]|nr:tetratricopeptide repeat protein [Verrucomicrobiales bacterium]